jgi:hypothetical protein
MAKIGKGLASLKSVSKKFKVQVLFGEAVFP